MAESEGPFAPAGRGTSEDAGNLAVARAALAELGIGLAEADALLRAADADAPVDEIIRRALRRR
jgi:hypothetical protein